MPAQCRSSQGQPVARTAPPVLGVGFAYLLDLPAAVYRSGVIDFVELTPEILCRETSARGRPMLSLDTALLEDARTACDGLPMVVHGVQLSIGSAHGCNAAYLDLLDRLQDIWPFVWHSEHLSFQTLPGTEGTAIETGVPLPLPATREAARLVIARCASIRQRYGLPFLLENPTHYLEGWDEGTELGDEFGLMRNITASGHCGQLLDLHNLYCNAINHDFDPRVALAALSLATVHEIHVAGGGWQGGWWVDAHNGRVPQPVWDLLAWVLPRCPNVAGVVFELLERHAPALGLPAILEELQRLRDCWERFRPRQLAQVA